MSQSSQSSLPLVAITMGDPAGIGPEQCLKVLSEPRLTVACRPLIIGDLSVLRQVSDKLGLKLPETVLSEDEALTRETLDGLDRPALVDCKVIDQPIEPGVPTKLGGQACYHYIELGIQGAMKGLFEAVMTAPITKATLNMAGIKEPGHTEIFGRLTQCPNFAMMLYSPRLAVSFVTCHQSLTSVPKDISIEGIRRVTALTGETLRRIRGTEPKIGVLGLNPHAGEDRMFGNEDADIVAPAIELSRQDGWDVEGPLSPDAAFMPNAVKRYDGHVTLYHDQGSIPFKMVSLHDGVNITMGLPIIRVSVDHGTAYNIAWQGVAEITSFISAIELASTLAVAKRAEAAAGKA